MDAEGEDHYNKKLLECIGSMIFCSQFTIFVKMGVLVLVYNLRGGFLGSVAPAPEQKDFRTQSTSIWVFWDHTKMF